LYTVRQEIHKYIFFGAARENHEMSGGTFKFGAKDSPTDEGPFIDDDIELTGENLANVLSLVQVIYKLIYTSLLIISDCDMFLRLARRMNSSKL
jgi:hypothetical protein